jgi:hypothetical protein
MNWSSSSDEQVSVCTNEALASLIYTIWHMCTGVSFHWLGRLLILGGYNHFNIFWVVITTLIYYGDDFSFSPLQLGFDQSAKGDLVIYNTRHDQSTKGD